LQFIGSGKLQDRVALITGGESGIGRAVDVPFSATFILKALRPATQRALVCYFGLDIPVLELAPGCFVEVAEDESLKRVAASAPVTVSAAADWTPDHHVGPIPRLANMVKPRLPPIYSAAIFTFIAADLPLLSNSMSKVTLSF